MIKSLLLHVGQHHRTVFSKCCILSQQTLMKAQFCSQKKKISNRRLSSTLDHLSSDYMHNFNEIKKQPQIHSSEVSQKQPNEQINNTNEKENILNFSFQKDELSIEEATQKFLNSQENKENDQKLNLIKISQAVRNQMQEQDPEQQKVGKLIDSKILPIFVNELSDSRKTKNKKSRVVRRFNSQLPKNLLIENSRKFLEILLNILQRQKVINIINNVETFVRDQNYQKKTNKAFIEKESQNTNIWTKQNLYDVISEPKRVSKAIKKLLFAEKKKGENLFRSVKKILDEACIDSQIVEESLDLLEKSDPQILTVENIDKLVCLNEEESIFEINHQSKDRLNISMGNHSDFFIKDQALEGDQNAEEGEADLIHEVLTGNEKSKKVQDISSVKKPAKSHHIADKQVQGGRREVKLKLKKHLLNDEEKIEVNEVSMQEMKRMVLNNKKVVDDKIIFRKDSSFNWKKAAHRYKQYGAPLTVEPLTKQQKKQFGENWIYAYDLPYNLTKLRCSELMSYISKTYGEVTEYLIHSYKSMLEIKHNIMIHVRKEKERELEEYMKDLSEQYAKQMQLNGDKPRVSSSDRLLEKIESNKNLKLHKSSMIFKVKDKSTKDRLLSPEMRLYGLNYKEFSCVRFEDAQSKNVMVLNMVPWGCHSTHLIRHLNDQLYKAHIHVTYEKCILAKGFIFIEFDDFYEAFQATQLLNNLQFQGHILKAQINYGSSTIYDGSYKNTLEFDHYEGLVNKIKEIKSFYNDQVYQ